MKRALAALALACALSPALACNGNYVIGSNDAGPRTPDAGMVATPADKVDLLLAIDNSASMADKQDLLASTMQYLVDRLVRPNCVREDDPSVVVDRPVLGPCPAGSKLEFAPILDLHVGVVTSSLGGGGADICAPDAKIGANEAPTLTKLSRHNDDRGHLVTRKRPDPANPPAGAVEDPVADAQPGGFLAWLPPDASNAGKPAPPVTAIADRSQLSADFRELVRGPSEYGCGLEAQLESWYRFLVQPDPYDAIVSLGGAPISVSLEGIDTTLLQQRRDFLRPDSVVAVVMITDEEDSWSDPLWLGGRGWMTRGQNNGFSTTGQLPRGTSACADPVDPMNPTSTGPNSPACKWCALKEAQSDPACAPYKGLYGPKEDGLNVRYTDDMKRRYGMNPQFPVQRYIDALSSATVPDRRGEHRASDDGPLEDLYVGRKNCSNPVFATALPTDGNADLCHLARGPRTADMVFFTIIGGVPWQLLTSDPASASAPFKKSLERADWVRLVGNDPATYQTDGIDPHMIESIAPRAGIACVAGAPNDCDPMHGREWNTLTSKVGLDLQYACTFPLPVPRDCTKLPAGGTCDCGASFTGPLCAPNPADQNNLTLQVRGKAYPTIRELRVAQGLGAQGVVGSICPRTLTQGDPDYGYTPPLRALVDRMAPMLVKR